MTGTEVYDKKYETFINNVIEQNSEIKILKGYKNFIQSDKSLRTVYVYLNPVVIFMKYINKNPEDLTLDDYTDFLDSIKTKGHSYRNNCHISLMYLSKYLVATGINEKNPMQYIKAPKKKDNIETIKKRDKAYLTQREIKEYVSNVENSYGNTKREVSYRKNWKERDVAIIDLFLITGMRCSALYKLDMENIDFENKKIITTEKEESVVEYYLSDEMMNVLQAWLDKREQLLNGKEENAVFISYQLNRISNTSISKIVNKYSLSINGKHITPHKLRGTVGTNVYINTGDINLLQDILNHDSSDTSKLYVRGQKSENKKVALNIMNDLVFRNK